MSPLEVLAYQAEWCAKDTAHNLDFIPADKLAWKPAPSAKSTLDIVNEHGRGDEDVLINSWSTSVDVDWRRWFVRVAHDPHVNYTPDRQWRLATGVRF